MFYTSTYQSPLGEIILVSDEEHLVGLWLGEQRYMAEKLPKSLTPNPHLTIMQASHQWLDAYFNGDKPAISMLALKPLGATDFRKKVWGLLQAIPYGHVVTYGDLAREMALLRQTKSMSAQAVGGAVGHNPISIIVPCHRVVGAKGNLTGYGGGLDLKVKLLKHEDVDLTPFYLPKLVSTTKKKIK